MNWKPWVYSIIAGGIGGFATTGLAILAMPEVFNFTHDGWIHCGKLVACGILVPVLTFLKQSPLPPPEQVTTKTTTLETKTTVTPAPTQP